MKKKPVTALAVPEPKGGIRISREDEDALFDAIARGVPLRTACALVGVGQGVLYEWLRIGNGKVATWNNGAEISQPVLEDCQRIVSRMQEAVASFEAEHVKRIQGASATVDKTGRVDWRASAFLLTHSGMTRDNWYEQRQQNIDVNISGSLEIEMERKAAALSDGELDEAAVLLGLPIHSAVLDSTDTE